MIKSTLKINFKTLFLAFLAVFALLSVILLLNVWITWRGFKQIQKNYQLSAIHDQNVEIPKKKFILNKNNKILDIDLQRLLPFMDINQTSSDWMQEQKDAGFLLSEDKKHLSIMENLEFELEAVNDCEQVQCYQKRIAFYDIPPALWRGLIGVEDERFLRHNGVDPLALLRAIWVDVRELRLAQGGSTITQQVARNLFLGLEKSFYRKWKEILFSFFMEYELSKEDILQIYLNEVFWGSLGNVRLKGVYAASVYYFGKKPVDLSPYEVSILIAMLKGPNYFHPLRNRERVEERANILLSKLLEMKLIPQSAKKWSKIEWNKWHEWLKKSQDDTRLLAIANLLRREKSQISFFEEYLLVTSAESTLENIKAKPKMKGQDMAYKIFVEDLSCVYGATAENGVSGECPPSFTYYSKQERDQAAAFQVEGHQIGSLLKPIVYRALISFGKNMSDSVSVEPLKLKLKSGTWIPGESGKVDLSIKEMTLREALQKSRNIPVVRLSQELGFDVLENYLYPYVPKMIKPLSEYPAQILGGLELTINDLAELYAKFIKDECFDIIAGTIDESTSPLLVQSHPDETTIASAASSEAKSKQFFGKTGTSNNANDNWFAGFDGKYLYILWFGNERKEQTQSLELSGAWYAYRAFEPALLNRGREVLPFDCQMFKGQ